MAIVSRQVARIRYCSALCPVGSCNSQRTTGKPVIGRMGRLADESPGIQPGQASIGLLKDCDSRLLPGGADGNDLGGPRAVDCDNLLPVYLPYIGVGIALGVVADDSGDGVGSGIDLACDRDAYVWKICVNLNWLRTGITVGARRFGRRGSQ